MIMKTFTTSSFLIVLISIILSTSVCSDRFLKGSKTPKISKSPKKTKAPNLVKEPKIPKDTKATKEPKLLVKEPKTIKESKAPRETNPPKECKESKNTKSPKSSKSSKSNDCSNSINPTLPLSSSPSISILPSISISPSQTSHPTTPVPTKSIPPEVTLGANLDPWKFNPTGEPFCFNLIELEEFDVGSVNLTVNDSAAPYSDFTTTNPLGQICTTSTITVEEMNKVVFTGNTMDGKTVSLFTIDILCGTFTVTVHLKNETNAPYPGTVTCKATSADDNQIQTIMTTTTATCIFTNLPDRTIIFEGKAPNGDFGATGVVLFGGTTVTVFMFGFEDPSSIDNNDFSLGLDGWNTYGTNAQIIGNNGNNDLRFTTGGTEGLKRVSRTIIVESPSTSNLGGFSIRYRFITSEIPTGWYGSRYNDFFFVMIRTQTAGESVSEVNSMNSLGVDAFDALGYTDWIELKLDVLDNGDTLQVDCGVANVGDGFFDSEIIIDYVGYVA